MIDSSHLEEEFSDMMVLQIHMKTRGVQCEGFTLHHPSQVSFFLSFQSVLELQSAEENGRSKLNL